MKIRDYFFEADRDVVLAEPVAVEHIELSTDRITGMHKIVRSFTNETPGPIHEPTITLEIPIFPKELP
jgi:hypothetical protein